jgi:plasmid maintenance system antidote protein VapI
MEQINAPLMGRIDGAAVVPTCYLKLAKTYRQAVRLCWGLRRAKGLNATDLAREFGFTRQHVTDYLNNDDAPGRRDLPADRIADFENVCGNTAITQWLAAQQRFTLLEEMQAERAAA